MKLIKKAGATSEIWQIFIADSSSSTGAGLTGLVFNSGSLTAYYHRDTDTTATAITLVTMTVGTFTSSGFKEIDATNMPGWYQFCPPNNALLTGAKSCAFHLKGATNMAPLPIECQLTAVDPDSATAFMTSVVPAHNSTGNTPALGIVDAGTLAGAGTSSAQLRSAASFANDELVGHTIYIVSGTGAGQSRVITGYVGSTDTAAVDDWITTPTGAVYIVFATPPSSAAAPSPVNVTQINGTTVNGDGSTTPWGP